MKRVTYQILPRGNGWGCKIDGQWIIVDNCATLLGKETYIRAVKSLARSRWKEEGIPSEVIVHNRPVRGRVKIGKGHGSRTTYGRDPRRTKG